MQALLHSVQLPTLGQATTYPCLHLGLLGTYRQVWGSLSWGHCSFLLGPGAQGSVCILLESISPVLCKFWQLCGGVNGDLLQESLCHTQVCCTQSLCPCGSPLLTLTPTGDTQRQCCLNPCGVSASWCGHCLSPLSISGRNGFDCKHDFAPPTIFLGLLCPWPWMWGISSHSSSTMHSHKCTGHDKHPLPTTQENTTHGHHRWSAPTSDCLYSLQPKMEKPYTVSKNKTGADRGSDHKVLIAKFRLKLKKVGGNH